MFRELLAQSAKLDVHRAFRTFRLVMQLPNGFNLSISAYQPTNGFR